MSVLRSALALWFMSASRLSEPSTSPSTTCLRTASRSSVHSAIVSRAELDAALSRERSSSMVPLSGERQRLFELARVLLEHEQVAQTFFDATTAEAVLSRENVRVEVAQSDRRRGLHGSGSGQHTVRAEEREPMRLAHPRPCRLELLAGVARALLPEQACKLAVDACSPWRVCKTTVVEDLGEVRHGKGLGEPTVDTQLREHVVSVAHHEPSAEQRSFDVPRLVLERCDELCSMRFYSDHHQLLVLLQASNHEVRDHVTQECLVLIELQ